MFNSLLWIGFAILDLSVTLAVFRYFGKIGIYALIVFDLLLCNIQVLKIVNLFGLTTADKRRMKKGVYLLRCALVTFFFAVNTLFFTLNTEQIFAVLRGLICL